MVLELEQKHALLKRAGLNLGSTLKRSTMHLVMKEPYLASMHMIMYYRPAESAKTLRVIIYRKPINMCNLESSNHVKRYYVLKIDYVYFTLPPSCRAPEDKSSLPACLVASCK